MTPRRILLLAALLLSCTALARGQTGLPYQINPPVPNASFTVCSFPASGNPCSNAASIFADAAESSPITQPVQLGSSGTMIFYVSAGSYTIQFSGTSSQSINFGVGGSGGSGAITNQVLNQLALGGSSATAVSGTVANPTTPNGVTQTLGCSVSGGACTPSFQLPVLLPRHVSGTTSTDTIVSGDVGNTVVYDGSVAVAVAVPTPTTLGVPQPFLKVVNNLSTTNDVTFTATTLNFQTTGTTTLVLHQNQSAFLSVNPNGGTPIWDVIPADSPVTYTGGYSTNFVRGRFGNTLNTNFGSLFDTNAVAGFSLNTVASAVNLLCANEAATGGAVSIQPCGASSDGTVAMNIGNKTTSSIFNISASGAVNFNPATGQNVNANPAGAGAFGSSFSGSAGTNTGYGLNVGGRMRVNATNLTAPTCAFTSGGGTSPSCALDTGSTDSVGIIIATTGTGSPASSGTITLTFGKSLGTNAPSCEYELSLNGAGQWGNLANAQDKTPTTASDLFSWFNATGSTPAGVALGTSTAFWINYHCWGK